MPKGSAVQAFTMHLGLALHRYGTPTHSLEAALGKVAERFGVPAQFLSTPTSITAKFGRGDDQRLYLERVNVGEIDLGKLSLLDELTTHVIDGDLDPGAARVLIDTIMQHDPHFRAPSVIAAYGAASAGVARLFGGGWSEMFVAMLIGFAIGAMGIVGQRFPTFGRVFELAAAAMSAVLAAAAYALMGSFSLHTAVLAGLIVLVPGLTFTTAMTELSTGHLVSGTARLMGAGMTFLKLGFGVALGTRVAAAIFAPGLELATSAPAWTLWPALVVAAISLTVILQGRLRLLPWVVAVSTLGYATAYYGAHALGPELAAFAASFVVTLSCNAYSHALKRTPMAVQVPAILLLVPGSVGYRALSDLMERDVLSGMQTAFSMIFTAAAMVVGLLLAGLLLPERI